MKVITLLNEKGGVGKTTLSVHIAAGLAARGHRVMLMDSDMQANASEVFGLKVYNPYESPDFYAFAKHGVGLDKVVRAVPPEMVAPNVKGALYLIPGSIENMNLPSIGSAEVLMERIKGLDGLVDYVIIDTAPTQTLFHVAVYASTDYILYPTQLEEWSISGVREAWRRRTGANGMRQAYGLDEIEVLGIQPVRTNLRTVLHQKYLEELKEDYGDLVLPPLPQRIVWAEASRFNETVFVTDEGGEVAEEAWHIIDRVLVKTSDILNDNA